MSESPTKRLARPAAIVWLIDGNEANACRLEQFCAVLGPGETARLGRFIRPERRKQYVLGRMLLRQAVSHFTGLSATSIGVIEREGNSPQLRLPSSCVTPQFSISHSAQWVACAASAEVPLGLDIESVKRERDVANAAEAAFSMHERQYVMEADGEERLARFYRVWTVKEALFKLESSQGTKASVLDVAGPRGMHMQGATWWSTVLPHAGLCITLCAAVPLQDVQLHIVLPGRLSNS